MQNQIPKYHETFMPILDVLSDGKIIHYKELERLVRDKYYADLPKDLLDQKIKSGANLIMNRIGWGRTYLKQAGMLKQPERAMVQITDKGKEVLKQGTLTWKELLKDEEFLAKREISKKNKETEDLNEEDSPQDMMDSGFRAIEAQVKIELLEKLKATNPYYFQNVILKLLEKMGYGDFIETPKSGDGGIDGIIRQDKLGLERIYIQAKRYTDNKVREGDIRNFIGAMSRDANKGVFVTTSTFDENALKKAHDAGQKIITLDGLGLVDLMLKYGVGVQVRETYEVKEIDQDFFETEY